MLGGPCTAMAIERLADGVATTAQLNEVAKTEATEALTVVAEQCATMQEQRLPKSVLTPVVMTLRESLSLSADLLQVWTTFGPDTWRGSL